MKKILMLIFLLALILAVCAKHRKRHGHRKRNRCFSVIQNCKKSNCFGPPTCNECDRGFLRVQAPLGFVCVRECPSTHKNVRGTCVRACTSHCKACKTADSCSVCERGYALFEAHCIWRCPKGYQTKGNPVDGKKCVKSCTANCKECETGSCSVCERGYALLNARCIWRCPKGYQTKGNPVDGKKCVKSCKVMDCALCPKWNPLKKCFKCKHDRYKLSVGRQDFCFSHCPSGYVPKTLNGANFCKKVQPITAGKPDQTFQPESTVPQNHTPTPEPGTTPISEPESETTTDEPTAEAEPSTTEDFTTQPESFTTPEAITEPEPTTFVDEDLWP